jgi:hypothetical protein
LASSKNISIKTKKIVRNLKFDKRENEKMNEKKPVRKDVSAPLSINNLTIVFLLDLIAMASGCCRKRIHK